MEERLVSVVVPVYNALNTLGRCVQSIQGQTFPDFELLLIDDGSNDGSGELCDELARRDSRVRVLHGRNCGVSHSRNVGLEQAKGQWLYFVDADDWLETDLLEHFSEVLAECPDMDSFRFGFFRERRGKARAVAAAESRVLDNQTEMFLVNEVAGYAGFVWNFIFRRDIVSDLRFRQDISWCEDHIFSLSLYQKCRRMYVSDRCLYHYTVSPPGSSLSTSFKDPYMVVKAAKAESSAKMACLAEYNPLHVRRIDRAYKAFLKRAIACLYRQDFKKEERKRFFEHIEMSLDVWTDTKYKIKNQHGKLQDWFKRLRM